MKIIKEIDFGFFATLGFLFFFFFFFKAEGICCKVFQGESLNLNVCNCSPWPHWRAIHSLTHSVKLLCVILTQVATYRYLFCDRQVLCNTVVCWNKSVVWISCLALPQAESFEGMKTLSAGAWSSQKTKKLWMLRTGVGEVPFAFCGCFRWLILFHVTWWQLKLPHSAKYFS